MNECIVWMNMLSYGHIDRISNIQKSWNGILSMIWHFIYLGHWFKIHTASLAPPSVADDAHGTAQGQAKQFHTCIIYSFCIFLHVFNFKPMTNTFIGHLFSLWFAFLSRNCVRASTSCSAPTTLWTLTC